MTRPRRKRTLRSQSCTVPCLVQWSSILRQRRDETWSMWNLTWVMLYLDVTSLINHTHSRPGPFRAVGVVSLPPFLPPSLPPSSDCLLPVCIMNVNDCLELAKFYFMESKCAVHLWFVIYLCAKAELPQEIMEWLHAFIFTSRQKHTHLCR